MIFKFNINSKFVIYVRKLNVTLLLEHGGLRYVSNWHFCAGL